MFLGCFGPECGCYCLGICDRLLGGLCLLVWGFAALVVWVWVPFLVDVGCVWFMLVVVRLLGFDCLWLVVLVLGLWVF